MKASHIQKMDQMKKKIDRKHFSNHWKLFLCFFQSLETFLAFFPIIGNFKTRSIALCILFALLHNLPAFAGQSAPSDVSAICRKAGWSEAQISTIQTLLAETHHSGVLMEDLYIRVQEGTAKKVDPNIVIKATRQRAELLTKASTMTHDAHCENANLMLSIGLALESGIPESVLNKVLKEGANRRPGQVQSVIEIGETLHLNGMPDDAIQSLMLDFLKRNLRRGEMIRAARVAKGSFSKGKDVQHIRKKLWGQSYCNGNTHGDSAGKSANHVNGSNRQNANHRGPHHGSKQ